MSSKLSSILHQIYGDKKIVQKILDEIKDFKNTNGDNSIEIQKNYKANDPEWYKSMNLYVCYPDSFSGKNGNTLTEIEEKIPYLETLGVDALHILPLFKSPLVDAGFDVSDYYKIREELGGNKSFNNLIKKCLDRDIAVFVDLVLNHISNQHEWFLKAQEGNQYYRDFFIHQKEKPILIDRFDNESGPFATYKIKGEEKTVRIIFPDFVGEIPHWTQGTDGYWYYHTFYPHQIDVNWNNPNVFIEFAKIIDYWARKGLNFRLDAIIFMGKDVFSGNVESCERVHLFTKAIHEIAKNANQKAIVLTEVVQEIETTKKYFGENKEIESELNYNFQGMNALWQGVLLGTSEYLYSNINTIWDELPQWAGWVNFLRNHDGLSLEFTPDEYKSVFKEKLFNKGLPFMAGLNIAGRTMSFLENCPVTLIFAYFLLASQPGAAAFIYGDELGRKNDFEFMEEFCTRKAQVLGIDNICPDPRDIHRGIIKSSEFTDPHSQKIYNSLSEIFSIRKEYSHFFRSAPQILDPDNTDIFAVKYKYKNKSLQVILNLSKKPVTSLSLVQSNRADSKDSDKQTKKVILEVGNVNINDDEMIIGQKSGVWILKS